MRPAIVRTGGGRLGRFAPAPTSHMPGTPGKVDVLEWRADKGYNLWHPLDATMDYEDIGLPTHCLARAGKSYGRTFSLLPVNTQCDKSEDTPYNQAVTEYRRQEADHLRLFGDLN